MKGHKCPLGHLKEFFRGYEGHDEDTAKDKCATACNARADCKFADLYWTRQSGEQACYLRSNKCGDYENNKHSAYRLYIKGTNFGFTKLSILTYIFLLGL